TPRCCVFWRSTGRKCPSRRRARCLSNASRCKCRHCLEQADCDPCGSVRSRGTDGNCRTDFLAHALGRRGAGPGAVSFLSTEVAMKAGWKTTEFWMALIAQVLALLTVLGFVTSDQAKTLENALGQCIAAVFLFAANAYVVAQYIKGRV